MTIAVKISSASLDSNLNNDFNYHCFSVLAKLHPEVKFIFIAEAAINTNSISQSNVTTVITGPQIKNMLLAHYWYSFKLPAILNKYNADYFFSDYFFCNLKSNTKQIIRANNDVFLKSGRGRKFALKSDYIIASNEYVKKTIDDKFPLLKNKTIVIQHGTDNKFEHLEYSQKESIKSLYSDGVDYFLLYAKGETNDKIIMALRAFSVFKKWQKSNMKLLIILNEKQETDLSKNLSNYKFKDDVKLISDAPEIDLISIAAASYTSIFIDDDLLVQKNMLDALTMNIPIILPDHDYFHSSFSNAALYGVESEKTLSKNMILLYKDENHRNQLIEAGKLLVECLDWNIIVSKLWRTIIESTET